MSNNIDSHDLPPTQMLLLELLAARYRLGHDGWNIHTKAQKAVEQLEAKGLVTWKHWTIAGSMLVWLTEEGKKASMSDSYISPLELSIRAEEKQ
jgi:hypothetical protein